MNLSALFITIYIVIATISVTNTASAHGTSQEEHKTSNTSTLDTTSDTHDKQIDTTQSSQTSDLWDRLWGTPAKNSLYLGMVTYHLSHVSSEEYRWNNNLIGGSYKGYFAGTLKNTFNDRAFAAGLDRIWDTQHISSNLTNQIGYRIGIITGYDERMMSIAKYTPVLPFPQIVDNMMYKNMGIELSWSIYTLSAGFVYHFN